MRPILRRSVHNATLVAACVAVLAAGSMPMKVAAQGLLCPETVQVRQSSAPALQGWSVSYSEAPNRLEMVTFFNGPPEEQASLVYDRWTDGKGISTATWSLPRDARGYWVRCSYSGTSVELSKRLAPEISSCQVIYQRQAHGVAGLPAIERIACRTPADLPFASFPQTRGNQGDFAGTESNATSLR
jgi:hypothetical protein